MKLKIEDVHIDIAAFRGINTIDRFYYAMHEMLVERKAQISSFHTCAYMICG